MRKKQILTYISFYKSFETYEEAIEYEIKFLKELIIEMEENYDLTLYTYKDVSVKSLRKIHIRQQYLNQELYNSNSNINKNYYQSFYDTYYKNWTQEEIFFFNKMRHNNIFFNNSHGFLNEKNKNVILKRKKSFYYSYFNIGTFKDFEKFKQTDLYINFRKEEEIIYKELREIRVKLENIKPYIRYFKYKKQLKNIEKRYSKSDEIPF